MFREYKPGLFYRETLILFLGLSTILFLINLKANNEISFDGIYFLFGVWAVSKIIYNVYWSLK